MDKLVSLVKRVFPDLEEIETELRNEQGAGPPMPIGTDSRLELESRISTNLDNEQKAILAINGTEGLIKIRKGNSDKLSMLERIGLEAVILRKGRPALLIEKGRFAKTGNPWGSLLESKRSEIQKLFPAIGRIEVSGHPKFDWIGTGFVVADNVIITNRHVAREFAEGPRRKKWRFITGIKSRIDFKEEYGSTSSDSQRVTGIVGVHEKYDFALIRISDAKRRPPLLIASKAPKQIRDRTVLTIGYPASDSRNDPKDMKLIFSDIFDVKRLQPGKVLS
jgi:hypothetical protein